MRRIGSFWPVYLLYIMYAAKAYTGFIAEDVRKGGWWSESVDIHPYYDFYDAKGNVTDGYARAWVFWYFYIRISISIGFILAAYCLAKGKKSVITWDVLYLVIAFSLYEIIEYKLIYNYVSKEIVSLIMVVFIVATTWRVRWKPAM